MMQPQKKLSVFDAAVHTTAGVTRTYGEIPNSYRANIVGGTTRPAAGEQVYDHAKRAISPAGSASEGPPNTPQKENEAAGAQYDVVKHAIQLHTLPSELPNLDITDKDSKIRSELLNASLTDPPTNKNGVATTPEGSISPETQLVTPENETEKATSRWTMRPHVPHDEVQSGLDELNQTCTKDVSTHSAAGLERESANKRDSTKSFSTMSSIFDSASVDTAVTANDDDPSTVFIQATSMDDIEGWVLVGEND